jgi:DNA-binding NtrC family response regulator
VKHDTTQGKFAGLVLEDDEICAQLIADVLRDQGGEVQVCGSVQRAREAVQRDRFDLFVLDHLLPDGTGSNFFYELRDQGLGSTAIMLTGAPDLGRAVELTRNGLFDYLTKPFGAEQLITCLRRAVLRFSQPEPELAFTEFIGQAQPTKQVQRLIAQAANSPAATVLLTGETGVGKDVAAQAIHQLTYQNQKPTPPFIRLNCPTLPAEMFEAELFGAEKGSYTGAHQTRVGLAEAAHGGTLFLDEIAEVPFQLQAKLLQFLESREYRRLGNTEPRQFAGRIVAATNRVLADEVKAARFRADLWYRLEVFPIHVAPLRERRDDLAPLAEVLLDKLSQKYQRSKPLLRPEDFPLLQGYDFPGNVRELRNLLERSLLQTAPDASWLELDRAWLRRSRDTSAATALGSAAVPQTSAAPIRDLPPLEAQEYALIKQALKETNGVIRRAAAKLGLSHQALLRRLEKWPELRVVN